MPETLRVRSRVGHLAFASFDTKPCRFVLNRHIRASCHQGVISRATRNPFGHSSVVGIFEATCKIIENEAPYFVAQMSPVARKHKQDIPTDWGMLTDIGDHLRKINLIEAICETNARVLDLPLLLDTGIIRGCLITLDELVTCRKRQVAIPSAMSIKYCTHNQRRYSVSTTLPA